MPVNLRIFVWYFKIFIPRQHSQKCHFCRCRCRFAVLSIFCRCRLTWYILCQAIPYGHCIIIPLSCPQNLSHDAVLVFIWPVYLLLVLQADDQDNTRCPSAVTAESSSSSDDVTQRGQLLSQLLRNMYRLQSQRINKPRICSRESIFYAPKYSPPLEPGPYLPCWRHNLTNTLVTGYHYDNICNLKFPKFRTTSVYLSRSRYR